MYYILMSYDEVAVTGNIATTHMAPLNSVWVDIVAAAAAIVK